MNTSKSIGELIRESLHVTTTTLHRDLKAEAVAFCSQWKALVGIPTTKAAMAHMMRRSLIVLNVSNASEVETVLAEVRVWLSEQWLMDLDIALSTATKRWQKACVIEDVILVDYI